MRKCRLNGDPGGRIPFEHVLHQLRAERRACQGRLADVLGQGVGIESGEDERLGVVEARKGGEAAVPHIGGRASLGVDDGDEGARLIGGVEQHAVGEELVEDTADRPDVDGGCVDGGLQQQFRRAVCHRGNVGGERQCLAIGVSHRAQVCHLEATFSREQDVGRLEITVQQIQLMEILHSCQKLQQNRFDHSQGKVL